MANYNERLTQNVAGKWYIDANCIDCDLCRETAPTVFRRDDAIGMSVVFHQPETEAEAREAKEGMEGCPVEAIGNDGPEINQEIRAEDHSLKTGLIDNNNYGERKA